MFVTMPDTMAMLILRHHLRGHRSKKVKNSKCSNQFLLFNFKFIRDLIYSTDLLTLSMAPAYTAPANKYAEGAHFLINLNEIALSSQRTKLLIFDHFRIIFISFRYKND